MRSADLCFQMNRRWVRSTFRERENSKSCCWRAGSALNGLFVHFKPLHQTMSEISKASHFGQLSCCTLWSPNKSPHLRRAIGEAVYEEWLELDRLVVRLWESHPFLLRVRYNVPSHVDGQCARRCMNSLLPEVTARGIADFTPEGEVGGR